jgi:peptidoglycan hydrolase-like protein with peptidoglycan-binding domain
MNKRFTLRVFTRALVIITAVAGIGLGSLTSASFAASAPAVQSAPSSDAVEPLAVVNLGLSTTQARYVQCWLRTYWGYTGALDGQLGTNSWKAFQRNLQTYWGYTGPIDGIVGSGTVSALQRLLRNWGYTGPIDGIAGSGTQAAFKNFANWCSGFC